MDHKHFSRRHILKQFAAVPLMLKAAPLAGLRNLCNVAVELSAASLQTRYVPHYPLPSPLEDVLRLVTPGLDGYGTEKHAYDLEKILLGWASALTRGDFAMPVSSFAHDVRLGALQPVRLVALRSGGGLIVHRCDLDSSEQVGVAGLQQQITLWLGPVAQVQSALFEVTSIKQNSSTPVLVQTTVRYSLVSHLKDTRREQRTGVWEIDWWQNADTWKVTHLRPLKETRSTLSGPGFVDVTQRALGATPSYNAQLHYGVDHWRTVLDGACGIDIYGNNGVAAGDYNGDGFDDLYVSQPAGLPNRLYRNRGDGTFEDVTEKAGVGVLDNTACALFADFRNCGLQDLLVVCGGGPLLFQNLGDGTFALKSHAFQFAVAPQGTFTHAAVADYDGDGHLDVYFCLYSYYLGLDQYHYPTPYFDARNGPPNFLMKNRGDGTFVDRTAAAGLSVENDRYSFACGWVNVPGASAPDLYVVNDFGRNNLYRSNGDGTFRAISAKAHVDDVGAGMSACWADLDSDGRPDLYVANMWSAAGQRVAQQPNFHAQSAELTRELYRRHASGNAFYKNNGDGTFSNVSDTAGVEVGRWAWGSDAWDFDQDGQQDLYVTNGYITALGSSDVSYGATRYDLSSFFWRQVVGKSPDDTAPSLAYERGWNALNELIRTDNSWSGNERNALFANNGDGTFSDVAGAVGLDFIEDSRAFALSDLDGDGRLEVIVKNRNAPQVRILHNAMQDLGDMLVLRLRGTIGNRDAIGAVVQVKTGNLLQQRSLQAGSGFLAQHTKQLFFGLGQGQDTAEVTVHWPGGLVQHFANLPRNQRIELVEGETAWTAKAFGFTAAAYTGSSQVSHNTDRQDSAGTWLLDPLEAPPFRLTSQDGTLVTLPSRQGSPALLHLWSTASPEYAQHLQDLQRVQRALNAQNIGVIAMHVGDVNIEAHSAAQNLPFPAVFATDEIAGVYNLLFRYMFDRRANLPLPTSFLLDGIGRIVKVYQGVVPVQNILKDAVSLPATAEQRMRLALPFSGTLHQTSFVRNDFTYGVAMFQHGYFDRAVASFEQVLARYPEDAEAHYNLGTLNLRRNDLVKARQHLQRTLELKPNYPEAWNNLGMIAAQQGQVEEAVRSFQQSLTQRPTYATALVNLGNVYRHEQQFSLAGNYLERALHLQPDDPETNYSVGMLYAQQDQLPEAKRYLNRAIDLRPEYPEALNNLGVLHVREQNYAGAETLFTTCIRLVPAFEGSYINLARLYLLQHDTSKARATLQALLQTNPQSAVGLQAMRALGGTP